MIHKKICAKMLPNSRHALSLPCMTFLAVMAIDPFWGFALIRKILHHKSVFGYDQGNAP